MESPKETWVVFRFVAGAVVASTSEASFSLLDCVEVVAQVVLDDVDVSLGEESVTGPAASLSSSLVAEEEEGGISELSAGPLGSSFTPRWF